MVSIERIVTCHPLNCNLTQTHKLVSSNPAESTFPSSYFCRLCQRVTDLHGQRSTRADRENM